MLALYSVDPNIIFLVCDSEIQSSSLLLTHEHLSRVVSIPPSPVLGIEYFGRHWNLIDLVSVKKR